MKPAIVFIAAMLLFILQPAAQKPDPSAYITLEKCLTDPGFGFSAKYIGSAGGMHIEAAMKNKSNQPMNVLVEPGRRFIADTARCQDLLNVKSYYVTIAPNSETKIKIRGFCCESSNSSPIYDMGYDVGFVAPEPWVKLASFIDRNSFADGAVQHAVWVISNGHDIAGVDCGNREQTLALRKILCDLTGKEMPWATVQYKEDSTVVFTGVVNHIRGDIHYYVRYNCPVNIVLTDKDGRLVKTLMESRLHGIGRYTFTLDLDVSEYPSGEYEVRIYEDEAILLDRRKFGI
jgi:hypothetical protein